MSEHAMGGYLMDKLEAQQPKPSPRKEYYVHYTVENPPGVKTHLVAGPYNEDDVIAERGDISTYAGVTDAYVSDSHARAPA